MTRVSLSLVLILAGCISWSAAEIEEGSSRQDAEMRDLTGRIEALGAKEPTLNGIETRLRLSELLQQTHPALAKAFLEKSLDLLRQHKDSNLDDNLVSSLLSIAPGEGQLALLSLDDKAAGYSAAIRYWLMRNHLDHAAELYRKGRQARISGLGVQSELLQGMASRRPDQAAALFRDILADFPPQKPTPMDVWDMLRCVSTIIVNDLADARQAIDKILPLLEPSALASGSSEITAKYRAGKEEVRTTSTQETLLFRVALYLHVLDPAAYARLRPRLGPWENLVASITDPQAAKAAADPVSYTYQLPGHPTPRTGPPPDFEKMTASDALTWVREKADPDSRVPLLLYLLSREGLSSPEQHEIAEQALVAVVHSAPGPGRYYSGQSLFERMRELGMDDAARKHTAQELATALSGTQAPTEAYTWMAQVLHHENTTIPFPDPSLEARMLLLDLQALLSPAYDFALPGLDGKAYRLKDQRGKVVVLNFWATWCDPCRQEMPDLEKVYKECKDKGLLIFAISDESAATVQKFLAEHPYTFPVLIDSGAAVFDHFKVQARPQSVVLDRDGKMIDQINDATTEAELLKVLRRAGLL